MNVVKLSASSTDRLYTPGNIPGSRLCYSLSRTQGPQCTRKDYLNKAYNKTGRNRTRNLRACSAAPHPTAPPQRQGKFPYVQPTFPASIDITRASNGAVGWGTALQTGRSQDQVPMGCLECFIDLNLPATLRSWSWFLEGKGAGAWGRQRYHLYVPNV
jgi:hypothetical protein